MERQTAKLTESEVVEIITALREAATRYQDYCDPIGSKVSTKSVEYWTRVTERVTGLISKLEDAKSVHITSVVDDDTHAEAYGLSTDSDKGSFNGPHCLP